MVVTAHEVIDPDWMIQYARKYNIDVEYAQTIYNILFLTDRKLIDGQVQFRMPRDHDQLNDAPNDMWTGQAITVDVDVDRGVVTWIGIEGVNDVAASTVDEPIAVGAGQSKINICRRVYDRDATRQANIDNFRYHAGCTKASASTYYQKIKQENQ